MQAPPGGPTRVMDPTGPAAGLLVERDPLHLSACLRVWEAAITCHTPVPGPGAGPGSWDRSQASDRFASPHVIGFPDGALTRSGLAGPTTVSNRCAFHPVDG